MAMADDYPDSVVRRKPVQQPTAQEAVLGQKPMFAAPPPLAPDDHPFDPEGDGYDYKTAREAGLKPQPIPTDTVPHWPSRDPRTGMVLKGRKHPTWDLAEQEDAKLGYKISKGEDGRYYSLPINPPQVSGSELPSADQVEGRKVKQTPTQFDEPHPLAQFNGRDPYQDLLSGINPLTGEKDPKLRQYLVTAQGRRDRADIVKEQSYLNGQIKAWKERKAAFDKQAAADVASAKGGNLVKPSDIRATDDIAASVQQIIGASPEKSTLRDGLTDVGDVTDLAMEFARSNPGMSSQRAVDWVGRFIESGNSPGEEQLRKFVVGGWDPTRSYVVLHPTNNQNIAIRVTPDVFKRLEGVRMDRWKKLVSQTQKDQESAAKRQKLIDAIIPPSTRTDKPSSPFLLY